MQLDKQSISPESTPFASHEISDTSGQQTLGLGPTGRIHKSKLPDNRAFWESVNAVEFTSRGSSRREVYRAVAYYASLTDKRICFASVAKLARRASLGTTATRSQLRALERDGDIETDGGRSGGRSGTRYRLSTHRANPTLTVSQPNAYRCVNPTLTVAEEVREEVNKEVQAAQPIQEIGSRGLNKPANRYTCSCGHSWPKSTGTVCYQCHRSVGEGSQLQADYASRYRSAHSPGSGALPVPGKYDFLDGSGVDDDLEDDTADNSAPSAKSNNKRRVAEKPTALSGAVWGSQRTWRYQRVDGSWS